MTDFDTELRRCAEDVEAALDRLLTADALRGPGEPPARLLEAMRHGALGGGKRLRPLLVRQTASVCGVAPAQSLGAGLAVELVHCYSLIHDDLPAMDDDDLRRGRPTVHKAFDEATAILAGDSLLTHAFGLLVAPDCHPDPAVRCSWLPNWSPARAPAAWPAARCATSRASAPASAKPTSAPCRR